MRFSPWSRTLGQLFILSRLFERLALIVYMDFVNMEKVFKCITQGVLWGVLWEYGVSRPLLESHLVSVQP